MAAARRRLPFRTVCSAIICLASLVRGDVGDMANVDPLEFIAALANMSEADQEVYLNYAGMMLEEEGKADCNIFGGPAECKEVPANSKFAARCKEHRDNLKVDCAYYSDAVTDLDLNPRDDLETSLGSDKTESLKAHCPVCLDNLQSLWCTQALPKCGSFKSRVQKALFPAVLAYEEQLDEGQPTDAAVAAAVPVLLKAMAKTMACKEMCEAVVNTCSCDSDGVKTLGEIITAAQKHDVLDNSFFKVDDILLKDIWDQPFCDLFASRDDPEFEGTCNEKVVKSSCSDKAAYCNGIGDVNKDLVEELVAVEIAHGMLGFLDGEAGLMQEDDEFDKEAQIGSEASPELFTPPAPAAKLTPEEVSDKHKVEHINDVDLHDDAAAWEEARGAPSHHHRHSTLHVILIAGSAMVLVAVLAALGWRSYKQRQQRRMSLDVEYRPLYDSTLTSLAGDEASTSSPLTEATTTEEGS